MSRLLLDTHALLWFVFGDPRMSDRASSMIEDVASEKVLSVASLWEIAIKVSIGKLDLGMSIDRFFATEIDARELSILAISNAHAIGVAGLPFHHRDPFDRLIVAQALVEGLTLITGDPSFAPYGATLAW
jgi:PIN domain nuclease of toxin-antitoxin system